MPSSEPKIFISYRRADSRWPTGRLHDFLGARFGLNSIFMDITDIEPGEDFVVAIEQALNQSRALIAVIGPAWLAITDEAGERRLDHPDDPVRVEIAQALGRDLRVIPVLIDETPMPKRAHLPADLARLCRLNALRIRSESFRYDAAQLTKTLERVLDLTAHAVLAGHWIDQTEDVHVFFRQARARVVGFYHIESIPDVEKVGVFWGTITGDTADFEWRWLDGSYNGQAVAEAPANATELTLGFWSEQDPDHETTSHLTFVTTDRPDWVAEADFDAYADFLAGD